MNPQSNFDDTTTPNNKTQPETVSQKAVENVQAGRDINIGDINQTLNQFFHQQNDFVKRENLEEYTSSNFPSPIKINELQKTLYSQRLLVLCGNHADKLDLAWHIVVKFREYIKAQFQSDEISIWECINSSPPQRIFTTISGEGFTEIKNTENATNIFLLPDIKPQHKLERIQEAAEAAKNNKKGNNYVIATTDIPRITWTGHQNDSIWWQISNESPLYNPQGLLENLISRLRKKSLSEENISKVSQIVDENLETFASTKYFIQSLSTQNEQELSEEKIRKALDSAKKDREISLKEWFDSLESHEKLLALSLSLFDGLFTDQFFAAVEQIVSNVWQPRDSNLRALDYEDLQKLGNYFDYSEVTVYDNKPKGFKFVCTTDYPIEIEISRIAISNPDDRFLLFKIAWISHRRQIINALKFIVQMVKESVNSENLNWELYGNFIRRKQFQNAISQTLSDIGLASTSAMNEVKNPLLILASHYNFNIHNVAASAISKWYINNNMYKEISEKELSQNQQIFFGTLQQFWSIAIEKENTEQKPETWRDYIGATVALAISYTGATCAPDNLPNELLNWLEEVSESPSNIIRSYFGYHTLSFLVPLHLNQLHQYLKKWTQKHQQLNHPIAVALARA